MIFCNGAPNSPAAVMRFSTSDSPNIFLRRRMPRAYNSLVSTCSLPGFSRRSVYTFKPCPAQLPAHVARRILRETDLALSIVRKDPKRFFAGREEKMKLRLAFLACLIAAPLLCPQAAKAAEDYPKRQIKLIVPFPAGAGPDQVARMLGNLLQDAFGQGVVVENRAGALGSIGAQEVARSAPDGYTLLMGTNTTQAANVAMLKNLPYDPARDFAPVIRTTTTAMVLVVKPD